MGRMVEGTGDGKGVRTAIVASRFNDVVTRLLLEAAQETLRERGAPEPDVVWVPGAFEIPVAARHAAESGRYQAVICLGCVIRGETPHFDHVAGQAAGGIQRVALDTGVPVIFGVLTTDTLEQALNRAGGKHGNKGKDAALAAIEMATLVGALRRLEA